NLSDDTLMLKTRRHLIQFALIDELYDNSVLFGFSDNRLGQMLLGAFRNPYFIHCPTGTHRFQQRMLPADPFLIVHTISSRGFRAKTLLIPCCYITSSLSFILFQQRKAL